MADRNLTSLPVEHRSGPALGDLIDADREWFGVSRTKQGAAQRAHRSQLETFRFWTPNTACFSWCIVADIDHGDGDLRALSCPATPSWVVMNPVNGHAQAGWVIHPVSHGPTSRIRPQQFLDAVASALSNAVGGDSSFSGVRSRNPFFCGASVWWGDITPRDLGDLKAALVKAGVWKPTNYGSGKGGRLGPESWPQVIGEGERDMTVFALARRAVDPETATYELAARCSPPLPPQQVEKLARQAAKYASRPSKGRGSSWDALSAAQAERARRSWQDSDGAKRRPSSARREAMSKGRAAANVVRSAEASVRAAELAQRAAPMRAEGLSWRAISAQLGVSVMAVRRALGGVSGQEPSGSKGSQEASGTSTNDLQASVGATSKPSATQTPHTVLPVENDSPPLAAALALPPSAPRRGHCSSDSPPCSAPIPFRVFSP